MCVKLKKKNPYGFQYNIMVNGKRIGEMYCERCRITDIEIEEKHRGKGYGKKSVKNWVKRRKSECNKLDTTPIMSDAMKSILEDLGFEKEEVGIIDDQYRYVLKT